MPLDGDLIHKILLAFQEDVEESTNCHCLDAIEISDRTGFSIVEISACLEQLGFMGLVQNTPDDASDMKWAIAPEVLSTIKAESSCN